MDILKALEEAALKFMDKRLPIENSLKMDILREINKARIEIERYLQSQSNVNLFYVASMVESQIRAIIERTKERVLQLLNDAVNNSFASGLDQSNRFLYMMKEKIDPMPNDEGNKSEILLALLLFLGNIVTSLFDDLLNKLKNDLTSAFIITKGTLSSREMSGYQLSKFIESSFDNISKRSEVIVQTETNRGLNHGILLGYIAAKKSVPQLKVKWVEVKDQKLCKHCRERANGGEDGDGVYPIGEITPPPLHPNCRCILIPFLYAWYTR